MKRIQKLLFVVATTAFGLLFTLGTAQAQVTSTSDPLGATQGAVDLTLQGTIQSALVLTIDTMGDTAFDSLTSSTMPVHSIATVDFGSFSTAQVAALVNGVLVRPTAGTAGAFAVAELTAMATYNANPGGPNAGNINLTLGAAGGTSPIVAGNTRVQTLPVDWTDAANGLTISGADTSICPNGDAVNGDCSTGLAIDHQLAVFIPDSQAAGNFTQVVTYTATAY